MANEAEQLHPLLRHHLVNTLGWKSLRPLQDQAIPPVISGSHALVLAPTAGGKTEAAIFPVISRMLAEEWDGTSILYICPLKALLNNLSERLSTYFEMVGYQSALWHGDVNASGRKRVIGGQPACLLTTPESIESMLVSSRPEMKGFLSNIRVIIVDEIHAFAGDDRGTHLLCLIERLAAEVPHKIQRIGLSATVGNPKELLQWLTCNRTSEQSALISVPATATQTEVKLDYVGTLENAALVISKLFRGEKRLVFCDSRRRVEELTQMLGQMGVDAYASHSSLSLENRRISEQAFAEGSDCVIIATSTLELGIDVGDLGRVIQIDAPGSVASFLQRLGRTGRRPNTSRNCLFLATSSEAVLQAAAIIDLWEQGFVEPIQAPRNPYHIAAQQVLTMCLQKGRLRESDIFSAVINVPGINDLNSQDLEALKLHMLEREFLVQDGPFLMIGPTTEAKLGRRHFLELLSVFSSPQTFEVLEGQRSVGFVDWLSLAVPEGQERKPLTLAGKSWDIGKISWSTHQVYVTPSKDRGRTRWHGKAIGLSYYVAQEIKNLLLSTKVSDRWTQRTQIEIESERNELAELATMCGQIYSAPDPDGLVFATFFGSTINSLIATALETSLAVTTSSDDFQISIRERGKHAEIERFLRDDLQAHFSSDLYIEDDLLDLVKFSECLPSDQAVRAFLGKVTSLDLAIDQLRPPQGSLQKMGGLNNEI